MGALKFIDDGGSIKFQDDVTLKFIEDPKLKFRDDPIKFKFQDDNQGSPFKAFDDVKFVGLDKAFSDHKMPGSDQIDPRQMFDPIVFQTAQPFILSTPHHSMAWAQTFGAAAQAQAQPIDAQTQQKLFETHLQQVKETRQQLQTQIKQLDEYEKKVTDEFRKLTAEQNKNSGKK